MPPIADESAGNGSQRKSIGAILKGDDDGHRRCSQNALTRRWTQMPRSGTQVDQISEAYVTATVPFGMTTAWQMAAWSKDDQGRDFMMRR